MSVTGKRGKGLPGNEGGQAPHEPYTCARAWVALHAVHSLVSDSLSRALADECGLTINDFEVLVHLEGVEPGRVRLTDLCEVVDLSQPALSRLIARLEQQGLICRGNAAEDRRAVLLGLTDRGRDVLVRAIPIHAACVRDVFTGRLTDEEQEILVEALSRVRPLGSGES